MIIRGNGIEYGNMTVEDLLPYLGKRCKVEFVDGRVAENTWIKLERHYNSEGAEDYIVTERCGRNDTRMIKSIEVVDENT